MKKLILFLLPLFTLAQNPTNFPYGIKNTAGTSNSTPTYFVTQETDGVHKKTPAALIATKSELDLKQTVFTGICQKQFLTENDFAIDNSALTLTISTVKNGTAISSLNPVRFFTDGSGIAVMHEKTNPVTFNFTNTTGIWYFYFDSSGNPIATQTPWTEFSTIATVYRFYWNATLGVADRRVIEAVEFHKNDVSWVDHSWKHLDGAKYSSGLTISSNAISTGTPAVDGSNAVITLSSGTILDDNIYYTVTNAASGSVKFTQNLGTGLLPATSGKFICISNSASGLLEKIPATDFPFLWNSGTNTPEYLTVNGTRTAVTANNYFVYYVYALQDPRYGETIKIKSAETDFANLTLAQAHNWEQLQTLFPTLRDGEIRLLYKLTFEYKTSYDVGTKKSVLRYVDDLRKQKTTTTAVASGTVPATNVSVSPVGGISSTNAQSALQELDSESEKLANKQNSLAIDGTGTKYPTVDAVNAALPKSYATIVYVNAASPNTATIFDDENPPITNDNALKLNIDNLYIGNDASTWVYNGSAYVTKVVPATSNFYIDGTLTDAGNNKTSTLYRSGGFITGGQLTSYSSMVSRLGASDTVLSGSNFRLFNNAGDAGNIFQLNASNGVDLWNYASNTWNKRFTFSSAGLLTAANGQLIGGTGTTNYIPKWAGTGTQGNSQIYDNGTSVGIGLSDPIGKLEVQSEFKIRNPLVSAERLNLGWNGAVSEISNYNFSTGGRSAIAIQPDGGNVLVGTTTDNGVDKLQVNGTISATSYTGSATLTGTPTAPTATAGTNTTQIATTAFVQAADAGNVKTTGAQSITGTKTFSNSTGSGSAIIASVLGGAGYGLRATSNNLGTAIISETSSTGIAIQSVSTSTGNGIVSNVSTAGSGFAYVGQNNGVNAFTVNKTGVMMLGTFTVATLPTPTTTAYATVTDATAPTYLGTLTGGGSVVCPVFYNGTAWVSH